jgi:hypothetical protein
MSGDTGMARGLTGKAMYDTRRADEHGTFRPLFSTKEPTVVS